ncbi:RNA-directed DNA polymerase, eukaryota, reverse transcriptase zinc-binding domain protein [Tanacetum coccineum]|uniref:RNA-directed DNA polymerase, eukaryota, reverse transcriptase zinc-binding domain protein n=1 Tax=Tanacetum coccineum TaxID=301880 RepID=A0ABQ5BHC6_9ASTR
MLDPDLSPQPPLVVNPPMKKFNKALKPLKTTRTMNPESKNTMKHDEMLGGSSDVTFKKVNSCSRSKGGDTVMVSEEIESWEDATDASIGKEGLVDFEEINNNGMDVDVGSKGSNESVQVKMVSNPSLESNVVNSKSVSDCLGDNYGVKPNGIDIMPEIPVPVAENPILNPDVGSGSKPKSPTRVSFGEVKRPGIFKVSGVDLFKGVKSVSNFDVEEGSRMNDVNMGDNGSVKKPFSFISALTGDKVSGNNKPKYVPGSLNDAGREVADMDSVIEDGSTKWNMTVIGHFVRYRISYREIMVVYTSKWEPGLCMSKPEVTKVPLWVKIYNLPLKAWNVEGISRIASRVGNPIIMDRITTAMCEKSYGRASFARVLVEVDSTKGLVDSVEVWYMMLDVEYTWRPPVCEHCKFFGHTLKSCNAKDLTKEEIAMKESMKPMKVADVKVDNNEGWKNVGYRRNVYGRGGFSNNGRGSFGSGRGNYMNTGSRGNGFSKQYVPVKRNVSNQADTEEDISTVMEDMGKNDGNEGANMDSVTRSGSASGSNSKEVKVNDGLSSKNRFSVLNDEENSEDSVKWREFCSRIDIMCDMGRVVEEEEKISWSDKMLNYYSDKWKSRKDNILTPDDVLRGRIDELQEKIVLINRGVLKNAARVANKRIVDECAGKKVQSVYNSFYAEAYNADLDRVKELKWEKELLEVDLFILSKQPLTDSIKEFWTEEMIEYYEGACEEIRSNRINGHYDDVEDGSNATASFMTADNVSNLHDKSMADMQGKTQLRKKFVNPVCNELFGTWPWVSNTVDSSKGCRIAVGWDPFVLSARLISQIDQVMHFEVSFLHNQMKVFVSYIYGENTVKGRRLLWKNLVDHKALAGNSPWVLLGDFNVSRTFEECSNSFRARDKGMMDFNECVQDLELEDVTSYGMFYTWIEKRKNPELGILKKLDRVMGNAVFVNDFDRSFANFLPYMTSDHCPAILVFPDVHNSKPKSFRFLNFLAEKDNFLPIVKENWNVDVKGFSMFVLAKRLKNMKKYMRRLNKSNGNVFEKAKFLKTELKRVQQSLDKDPHNAVLREEEMIYSKAYSDAVLDEERLMKQKAKIEWLREGDNNTAYFHKILKGRVSKSRIEVINDDAGNTFYGDDIPAQFVEHFKKFLGADDVVFPIQDCEGLFTKKLDPQIANHMIRPVPDEEIKASMFSIQDDKAAGPDGFTSKFFKKAWSIVGPDVCRAVREFFTSGKLLGELNTNLISLVPKLKTPRKLSDYRPIACCNVVYKCISKVLTNRLKEGLDGLVDVNQCAFIPGRHISDNILITQELMFGYSWKVGARKCAFKVDIKKAYDTVNWEFLRAVLVQFGIHDTMINWIMVCLTTASFSLCVNGEIHGFFKSKRGLRQGDPMSPYLFTLIMEVLNLMIKRHISIDKRFRYHYGCKKLGLTHLCFADDLLLLCHGDPISACILRRGMDEFSMSSGLYPSLEKSTAFFSDIPIDIKEQISLALPFKEGSLPVRYLGVPMMSKKLRNEDCRVLIDNVKKRIFDWRNKYLSYAGLGGFGFHIWDEVIRECRVEKSNVPVLTHRFGRHKGGGSGGIRGVRLCSDKRQLSRFPLVDSGFVCISPWEGCKPGLDVSLWIGLGILGCTPKVIFGVCIKKPSNSIWSVIQRLVLGASVYFNWQERNVILFDSKNRSIDVVLNIIVNTVRLKLLSLNLKWSRDVGTAVKVWHLPNLGLKGNNLFMDNMVIDDRSA